MVTQHSNFVTVARRLAAAVVVFAFGTVGSAFAAENLTLTAGSPGGGYFKAAAAFAEYIKKEIPDISTTVIPGGGWANIERIDPKAATADVAVLENALASMAYEGTGPTGKKYDFRMLAAFRQPGAAQMVIVDSLGFKSFEDIKAILRIRGADITAQVDVVCLAERYNSRIIGCFFGIAERLLATARH